MTKAVLPRTAPKPAESDPQPLFRAEVMAERQSQWLGTVLLEPRLSHRIFATVGLVAGIAVLSLLIFGSYTRKAHLNGWLVSQQGVARIFAPQNAVVARIDVQEGATVTKDSPLLVLSTEVRSEAAGATQQEVVRQVITRRDSAASARAAQERLFDQQAAELRRRLDGLAAEQAHLATETDIQRARLALSEQALSRDRAMRSRDLITLPRLQRTEQDNLDYKAKLAALERSQIALQGERDQAEATLRELPLRRQSQIAEMERGMSTLAQELVEAEARRQIVITAPQDGTVTAIQAEAGTAAQPNVPLMSIVPTGAVLQAQLFAPSRAVGFVRPGQRVLLRYQAFPYQKFGFYEGTVSSLAQSSLSPSELPQPLAGLTGLYGANEPLYRLTVDLAQQTAAAYGRPAALQPGMQVEADVLIERRTLIEWVFDPVFSMTGKWHG